MADLGQTVGCVDCGLLTGCGQRGNHREKRFEQLMDLFYLGSGFVFPFGRWTRGSFFYSREFLLESVRESTTSYPIAFAS